MGIQASIDRKKQERSTERMAEAGINPADYVAGDRPIPDFPGSGEATIFFQRVPDSYIMKHANDKFSIGGRRRLSYLQRLDVPSYSPDSIKVLQGPEAWQRAKELLKAVVKGDTDKLEGMADEALKRGGLFRGRNGRRF